MRAAERLRFPEVQDDEQSVYDFESLDFAANGREMNAYLADFRRAGDVVRVHAHEAAEFLYVMTGRLTVQVDGVDHHLGEGDSIYINPSVPHGYVRDGGTTCRALVVTTAAPGAAAYG